MRIHHLSCGTFCPPSPRLINGHGGLLGSAHLDCHCLLIEARDGLVLVDTGLGVADLADPAGRIGPTWSTLMRPPADPERSALRQIEALGYYHDDVREIVVTHLDFDHAGGLPDFPQARVHVFEPEFQAAMRPRTALERFRYKPTHWSHQPRWARYELAGESWQGFESVRALGDAEDEILLVPLQGHTRGHCGVAVRAGDGWLLHAGDAYFAHSELAAAGRHGPWGLKTYERVMEMNRDSRVANQERLRALHEARADQVRIICSHDPEEFAACRALDQVPRALRR